MNELKRIKKYYGEDMMHFCHKNFSTILEKENILFSILLTKFAKNKHLFNDLNYFCLIEEFKSYIFFLVDNYNYPLLDTDKDPFELMELAGYKLYECITEEDIQQFKKYYDEKELLCTFNKKRLKDNYVFFAIKFNANKLNREDFPNPEREDEYGTSVISIQFSKGPINLLSIKNRYNHSVLNPDATFSNNLEKIIPGLTMSFKKKYKLNIFAEDNDFEDSLTCNNYILGSDKLLHRVNTKINNISYCSNNIIIDNGNIITKYCDKSKYLIIDYFIIDLQNKKIELYDRTINDSYLEAFNNIIKIEINKNNNNYIIVLTLDYGTAIIKCNEYNQIIEYENKHLECINNNFLSYNLTLKHLNMPNIKIIKNNFLMNNKSLLSITLDKVNEIGDNFLKNNIEIKKICMSKIKKIGNNFLLNNIYLSDLYMPKIIKILNNFMPNNHVLTIFDMSNLEIVGNNFFKGNYNKNIKNLYFPKLKIIGDSFFYRNTNVKNIYLPEAIFIANNCLCNIDFLQSIILLKAKYIGNNFASNCQSLKFVLMPNLIRIGDNCFNNCKNLKQLYIPIKNNNKIIIKNK